MPELTTWLMTEGGIAHRQKALRAGYRPDTLRRAVSSGEVRSIRRTWLALPTTTGDAVRAAERGGRVACVSLARARGWWLPEGLDDSLHLSTAPHSRSDGVVGFEGTVHWTRPIAPNDPFSLEESIEDALDHVAGCLPGEHARVLWDSAVRRERLDTEALRIVRWRSRAASECAAQTTGLSDSGLESIFVYRLSPWGIPFRQQIVLIGRPVDVLIGERLVIQVDGYAHHSSSADRTRDVAHDAELRLRGYTVLRFTYAQILHDWPAVARTISRAIAAGAHLAS